MSKSGEESGLGAMAAIEFPSATYRLQLSGGPVPFEEVRGLVDYFRRLGIGALYLSPFFRAAAGSTHGYDVVDPTEIEPRLGTEEDSGAWRTVFARPDWG